jgi:hypothetical protein
VSQEESAKFDLHVRQKGVPEPPRWLVDKIGKNFFKDRPKNTTTDSTFLKRERSHLVNCMQLVFHGLNRWERQKDKEKKPRMFESINTVPARVPIVQLTFPAMSPTTVEKMDISFFVPAADERRHSFGNIPEAVKNTRRIKNFLSVYPDARQLFLLLKQNLSQQKLNSTNSGVNSLVLFCLVATFFCVISSDLHDRKLSELLYGFLAFYCRHVDFAKDAISLSYNVFRNPEMVGQLKNRQQIIGGVTQNPPCLLLMYEKGFATTNNLGQNLNMFPAVLKSWHDSLERMEKAARDYSAAALEQQIKVIILQQRTVSKTYFAQPV